MSIATSIFNGVFGSRMTSCTGPAGGDWDRGREGWELELAEANLDIEVIFSRNEWNLLADLLQNVKIDPAVGNSGDFLPAQVNDPAWTASLGARWLDKEAGESVQGLARKVSRLGFVQAWALVTACAWFWKFQAVINRTRDAWWTLAYRQEKTSRLAREKLAPDGLPLSYVRDGYWWNWFPGNGYRSRGRKA